MLLVTVGGLPGKFIYFRLLKVRKKRKGGSNETSQSQLVAVVVTTHLVKVEEMRKSNWNSIIAVGVSMR